jgi:hypothetical protein
VTAIAAFGVIALAWLGRRLDRQSVLVGVAERWFLVGLAVVPPLAIFAMSHLVPAAHVWSEGQVLASQLAACVIVGSAVAEVWRSSPMVSLAALAVFVVLNDPLHLLGGELPRRPAYQIIALRLEAVRSPQEAIFSTTHEGLGHPLNAYLSPPDTSRDLAALAPSGLNAMWLVFRPSSLDDANRLRELRAQGWRTTDSLHIGNDLGTSIARLVKDSLPPR